MGIGKQMGVGKKPVLGGRDAVKVAIVQKAPRFLDKEASLARADPKQHLMDQLRCLGHHPHRDTGAAADEGGQHDQPDFVGPDQRTQRLRRMQHGIAERAAGAMVAGGRGSPGVRGCLRARDG